MKTNHTPDTTSSNRELADCNSTLPHRAPDETQPHDEELMSAIQQRDTKALETLLDRYRGLLRSIILRIVHDYPSADDVMQDCLIEIWNHADHYSAAKGKPLGWMVTMAKRRAIDYVRRQIAYGGAMTRFEDETRKSAHTTLADTACEDADLSQCLQRHLHQLPPAQQLVISLAYLKGMSQREVARVTNTPLGTVKTRMELGLRKLRTAFRTRSAMHSLQAA